MAQCGHGFQMTLSWIPEGNGRVPRNPVDAGQGVVVIRGRHGQEVLPGKLVPGQVVGHVPYGGKEFPVDEYEVLCETGIKCGKCYDWVPAQNGQVPPNAVVASVASDNSPLYVARNQMEGDTVVGKVHQGHTSAYFPFGGQEVPREQYEVLVWMMK
ncbi:Natterin-4 [Fasciola hepatica]|uniref:Natterin-4 n=1 Tax=Fasciola hepatica TaxID=6192 RepID=A0A4E0R246_FASHE|nr:Natterin-4 [Fasciola hepatica]